MCVVHIAYFYLLSITIILGLLKLLNIAIKWQSVIFCIEILEINQMYVLQEYVISSCILFVERYFCATSLYFN